VRAVFKCGANVMSSGKLWQLCDWTKIFDIIIHSFKVLWHGKSCPRAIFMVG
jgi:hypothetical protein